ncbi:MAG: succinate dehydrogenase assembly factor 2 [Rhizobiaceae bacterium]|nr:succinate dehydrogenase assembly factor 2 [Rhizobiaceae bacterium]
MTGTARTSEGLDARRKRLLFRSWHRGLRELDLILGPFADSHIEALNEQELDQYEYMLTINDTDLLPWLMGERPAPTDVDLTILNKIRAFRPSVKA